MKRPSEGAAVEVFKTALRVAENFGHRNRRAIQGSALKTRDFLKMFSCFGFTIGEAGAKWLNAQSGFFNLRTKIE